MLKSGYFTWKSDTIPLPISLPHAGIRNRDLIRWLLWEDVLFAVSVKKEYTQIWPKYKPLKNAVCTCSIKIS